MLENYSDNIIVLGTVGVSLFTYYYIVNYIYNYDNIKIYKFKDFDYKIITNEIKLINKTGVTLKIIVGKEYNKNIQYIIYYIIHIYVCMHLYSYSYYCSYINFRRLG